MKSFALSAALLACCAAFAQRPAFEVASIKPAQPMPMNQMRIRMAADEGMLRYSNVSLKDCIRVAYRVKDFQVQGPDWLSGARFEITAKLPDGASKEQIPEMLQALLADRFKLAVHRDTREHPIYAMVVAKDGPKLKPAEVPAAGSGPGPRGNMMIMIDQGGAHLKASSATLATLAEMISRFSERPVVDMTGVQGQYDFDLVFSPETMRGVRLGGGPPPGAMPPGPGAADRQAADAPAEPAASIYDSVRRYGLKLEPRKAPLEMIVVDHVEKEPTEN